MNNTMRALVDRLAGIAETLRGVPHFEWGTVTSVSPLLVRLDGDEEPVVGQPSTTVPGLAVGVRVRVELQNRRAVIVGRADGAFGGTISPTQVTNWDDAKASGFYWGQSAANGPRSEGWFAGVVTTFEDPSQLTRVMQEVREAKGSTHDTVWRRYWHGTGWGAWTSGAQRILWEGQLYLTANQTASLSELVSDQATGIILAWSAYADGAPRNDSWNYTFVPRSHVQLHPGAGVLANLLGWKTQVWKYAYVHDNRITGHADAAVAPNNTQVLRRVIGV